MHCSMRGERQKTALLRPHTGILSLCLFVCRDAWITDGLGYIKLSKGGTYVEHQPDCRLQGEPKQYPAGVVW